MFNPVDEERKRYRDDRIRILRQYLIEEGVQLAKPEIEDIASELDKTAKGAISLYDALAHQEARKLAGLPPTELDDYLKRFPPMKQKPLIQDEGKDSDMPPQKKSEPQEASQELKDYTTDLENQIQELQATLNLREEQLNEALNRRPHGEAADVVYTNLVLNRHKICLTIREGETAEHAAQHVKTLLDTARLLYNDEEITQYGSIRDGRDEVDWMKGGPVQKPNNNQTFQNTHVSSGPTPQRPAQPPAQPSSPPQSNKQEKVEGESVSQDCNGVCLNITNNKRTYALDYEWSPGKQSNQPMQISKAEDVQKLEETLAAGGIDPNNLPPGVTKRVGIRVHWTWGPPLPNNTKGARYHNSQWFELLMDQPA